MKIICIGKNAGDNNKTGSGTLSILQGPSIQSRMDSALQKNGKPLFVPDFMGRIGCEAQIALRVCKLGKTAPLRFAPRYYDAATVACCFTATDFRQQLLAEGMADTPATSFDGAVCLGNWIEKEKLPSVQNWQFALNINGQQAQSGKMSQHSYSADEIIAYVSRFFTLKTGDIILTGALTPDAAIHEGDQLEASLCGQPVLSMACK